MRNNYLKILGKDGFIYGTASVVTKIVHIFLIPLYSYHLSPEEYGEYSMLNTIMILCNMLVFFSLEGAVSMYFYKSDDEKNRNKVFSNWIYFMWLASVIISSMLYLSRGYIYEWFFSDSQSKCFIELVCINTLLYGLQYIMVVYFRYRRQPWSAVLVALLLTVLTLFGNYIFVDVLQYKLSGILYSHILISFVFTLIGIYVLRKCLHPSNIDLRLLQKMLSFSLPLVPASLVNYALSYSIIFFIDYYNSRQDLGIYQVSASLGGLSRLFVLAFMIPWNTIWFSISKEQNANQIYRDIVTIYLSVGLLCAVTISLLSDVVIDIFSTQEYEASFKFMGIIAIYHIISALPQITLVGSALKGDNRPYLYAMLIGSVFTICFMLLFTGPFGIFGACYAMIIGAIITQITLIYFVNRIKVFNYRFDFIAILLVLSLVFDYFNTHYVIPDHKVLPRIVLFCVFLLVSSIMVLKAIKTFKIDRLT